MEIVYEATFGDEIKTVRISHDRWGHGGYNVLINNRFNGSLAVTNGVWRNHLRDEFTMDDFTELVEIISNHPKFKSTLR